MKTQKMLLAWLLITGAAFASAQVTSANNSRHARDKPAISITLSVRPQQATVGEPILLQVSLKNVMGKTIFVGKEVSASDDSDYDVFAADDHGVEAPMTPYYRFLKGKRLPTDPVYRSPLSRIITPLQPDGALESQIDLDHLRTITHPGTYRLWVERFDKVSQSRVKSNVAIVTVMPQNHCQAASASPTFAITIQAVQSSVRSGAPVKVLVNLKNISNQKIPIVVTGRGGSMEYIVHDSHKQLVQETPYGLWKHGKDPKSPSFSTVFRGMLDPGASLTPAVAVVSKAYDMVSPGTYTIQAVRWDSVTKMRVTSNVVTVTVNP